MMQIVNDEIVVPDEMMENRIPTQKLRFRNVGAGRTLLEQLWVSASTIVGVNIKSEWVPVGMVP